MKNARNLHEVIRIIDEIAAKAIVQGDRIGYFAALYRHVAVRFAWGIARGEFEHPALMERLDVVFFNRYFDALGAFKSGEDCTRCWEIAFRGTRDAKPSVVQHLLAGMHAHIDFDLSIAVAESVPKSQLAAFRADFDKMNDLLASLVTGVLADLSKVWSMLGFINKLFGKEEDDFVDFSIRFARFLAWENAGKIAHLGATDRALHIRRMDHYASDLGRAIVKPAFPFGLVATWIHSGEKGTVAEIIRELLEKSGDPPPRAAMDNAQEEAPAKEKPTDDAPSKSKRRIVVLGGGQSALTAAFQLTHPDNPRAHEFEVSVYQLGWRLGGKGATGRNPKFGYRIEEHGLHNWFGFYDNCFRQIQDCYRELGRAPDAPLATWQQAFHPANEAVFTEDIGGKHLFWVIKNPPNLETPGTGQLFLPLWEYALMAIEAIAGLFHTQASRGLSLAPVLVEESLALETAQKLAGHAKGDTIGRQFLNVARDVAAWAKHGSKRTHLHDPSLKGELHRLLKWAGHEIDVETAGAEKILRHAAVSTLRAFMQWLWRCIKPVVHEDTEARRAWILANLGFAIVDGCLKHDVFERGFDVLDEYNFRPWLAKFAIDDGGVMLGSPVVNAIYDSSFAYEDGDTTIPPDHTYPPKESFETGTALRGMVRSLFTYKGSFGYRFAAGTADTCYAPMYLVMKKRRVAFHFFHQVVEVVYTAGDPAQPIEKIRLIEQVEITPEQQAKGGYDPLFDVKGLPCWPNAPQWAQIVDGAKIAESGLNVECPPKGFAGVREVVLERGKDFDDVVLGISIAALPWICGGIIAASPKWQAAMRHVKTVRTQGLQLWLSKTSSEMGFPLLGAPIASWNYDATNSLNVWGDLTELLPLEAWPVSPYPLNLGYYTSPLPDDPGLVPDLPLPVCYDCDEKTQIVRANAIRLLDSGAWIPWPKATHVVADEHRFDWELLVDIRPGHHEGQERIDSQFFKANVALTERYVLSVPKSSVHRLQVHDEKEFPNLYLTGDWTWCGLNCGAMESATMSGMLCSLALSGFPEREAITGVDFGHGGIVA